MKVIFLSYANSQQKPLDHLSEEDDGIYKLLAKRQLNLHFLIHRDTFTTRKKIVEYLTYYRHNVFLFHFSGHAGNNMLLIEEEKTRAEGIAQILGLCPNLKLIILNGCSTKGQVKILLENCKQKEKPIIVATNNSVADNQASSFGIDFYRALNERADIQTAFDIATGGIKAGVDFSVQRGESALDDLESDTPAWGLYYDENNESLLKETLPANTLIPAPESYQTNERLTNGLWKIWFSNRTEEEDIGDKQVIILNSLPRPIAEHLRKLMCPIDAEEQEGYDKINEVRLKQVQTVFETTMEFLTFMLLANLGDKELWSQAISIPEHYKNRIASFFEQSQDERRHYSFKPLICDLIDLIKESKIRFFIKERRDLKTLKEEYQPKDLKALFEEEGDFKDAYTFMDILRKKLYQGEIGNYEVKALCIRAEECIVDIFNGLDFLTAYTLAAIKNINVLRYRHLDETQFSHSTVKLMRVFGKLKEEELSMNKFLFNKSVILMKKSNAKNNNSTSGLNLSPFIIDENAFDLKTDKSRLYFYSYSESGKETYQYKNVSKPNDSLLEVSEEKYDIIKKQFDAFKKIL